MKQTEKRTVSRAMFLVVLAALTLSCGWSDTPTTTGTADRAAHADQRLVVRITGTRGNRGEIVIALFRGPRGFPDSDSDAIAHQAARVTEGGTTIVTFEGLKPGEYAVALFHDENENGKLDTSLGFPLEGFGTSNNPPLRWRAPTYKESRFELDRGGRDTTITIKLRYLSDNNPA